MEKAARIQLLGTVIGWHWLFVQNDAGRLEPLANEQD